MYDEVRYVFVESVFFDEWDEEWGGVLDDFGVGVYCCDGMWVGVVLDGVCGCDDVDFVCVVCCGVGLCVGFDDVDDGYVEFYV